MSRIKRLPVVLLLLLLPVACGTGHGDSDDTSRSAALAGLLAIDAPFPGLQRVPFVLTLGAPVGTVVGSSGVPQVRFDAIGGTPFLGGTSSTVLVTGAFASPTSVTGASPLATLDMPVLANVVLVLPGGLEVGGLTARFDPPTVIGFAPMSIMGDTPTSFSVAGAGYAPIGGPVIVRFRATSAAPFAMGTAATIDVPGMIASSTTVAGTTPDVGVLVTVPASVEILFPEGSVAASAGVVTTFVPPPGRLVINEVDYDQPGTDNAEFVELYNAGPGPFSLDTVELRIVNGFSGGATVVRTFDLPNIVLPPGAYYVISANAATVPNTDLDVSPDTNLIQNGAPDAIGLYDRDTLTLLDSVSYEGDSGAPYTEGSGAGLVDPPTAGLVLSLSRVMDGVDTDVNNVDFRPQTATPGTSNNPP